MCEIINASINEMCGMWLLQARRPWRQTPRRRDGPSVERTKTKLKHHLEPFLQLRYVRYYNSHKRYHRLRVSDRLRKYYLTVACDCCVSFGK